MAWPLSTPRSSHQALKMPVSAQSSLLGQTGLTGRASLCLGFHYFSPVFWGSTVSEPDPYLCQATPLLSSNIRYLSILCGNFLPLTPHHHLLPNQNPEGRRVSSVRTRSTVQPGLTSEHKGMTTTTTKSGSALCQSDR